jgi:hypothetical protein
LRKLRLVLALAAVATFASGAFFTTNAINGVAPAPNADDWQVITPWKDATCEANQFLSFKVDPVADGTYGGGAVIISNAGDKSFDWAIHPDFLQQVDISAVIVKGGPDASLIYFYNDNTDDSDTGLVGPEKSPGKRYGVSHITFCFDKKGA